VAKITDPNLVNAWGITASPMGPFWISDNGTGFSTVYNGAGQPFPASGPLVVTIPPPAGSAAGTTAAPTGVVFNSTTDFTVTANGKSGTAIFIFATEDGTISGWSPSVDPNAILAADNSQVPTAGNGAVYKGLALGSNATGNFLFATNFRAGTIDVFDKNFAGAKLSGNFSDPNIPAGFAPFGIANISGNLYVTYAKQNAEKHDDVSGAGNGYIDEFDTNGNLLKRLVTQGALNSPWGLTVAPANFGERSNDLLIGNFGDGTINAFDPTTGAFLGPLQNQDGSSVTINGLWGLDFGNGAAAGSPRTLFFTAGIGDEAHGLFGKLQPNADLPLVATGGVSLNAQAGQLLTSATVATFTDADPASTAGSFTATIQWGDGTASLGTIQSTASGFQVAGSHTFAQAGSFTVTVAVKDNDTSIDAGGAAATATDTATVTGSSTPTKNPEAAFVAQVFLDLLRRTANQGDLDFWTGQIGKGVTREQVALGIEASMEYRRDVVEALYQKLLHRLADAFGLNLYVGFLGSGGTAEQLEAVLIGSNEYLANRGNGTIDGFLSAAYQDILSRPSDSGTQFWKQALANGATRTGVAGGILVSLESDHDEVQAMYRQLLGRTADQNGLAFFTNFLQQGGTNETAMAMIIASDEYFARANASG
jgi:uncharacterized protein (TIGR03118 family)